MPPSVRFSGDLHTLSVPIYPDRGSSRL